MSCLNLAQYIAFAARSPDSNTPHYRPPNLLDWGGAFL
jgi:hypothetical protein